MTEGDRIEFRGYTAKLTQGEVVEMITELEKRFEPLWERVRWRRKHYHNLPAVDPQLPAQYETVVPYQSDLPRRMGQKLKARLVENQFVVRCNPPRDSSKLRKPANDLEAILMQAKSLVEERYGISIQGGLASGAIEDCYGVLHWCFDTEDYPDMGEHEYREKLGEHDDEKAFTALYRDDDEPDDAESTFPYRLNASGNIDFGRDGSVRRRRVSRYRETDDALQERWKRSCASAGFPLRVEFVPADMFAFARDRKPTVQGEFAVAMVAREVPRLAYERALAAKRAKGEHEPLSLNEANPDLPIYEEMPGPRSFEPSFGAYGDILRVYELWTRDEVYEVIGGQAGIEYSAGEVVDCFRHPYGEPPFALAHGNINENTFDPVLRYEPALEGIYRLKPVYDRIVTLLTALAEMIALPYYYWRRIDTGEPLLDEGGQIRVLTRNAVNADTAPVGYELVALPYDMNPAFMTAVELIKAEFEEAAPTVGAGETTASTQPWAIRLKQAEAAVEPRMLLENVAKAITKFERNVARVMSCSVEDGGPGEIFLYGVSKDGKPDQETIVSVKPEQIKTLNIAVDIKGTSEAEQITKEAWGREMLAAGTITMADYLENYRGVPDPDEYQLALDEEYVFNRYIKDQKLAQLLAANGLLDFMLGPNGEAIAMGGAPTDPRQVLAANGWQSAQEPQQQPQQGGGGQPGEESMPQTQMPDMASLQTPGTLSMRGPSG